MKIKTIGELAEARESYGEEAISAFAKEHVTVLEDLEHFLEHSHNTQRLTKFMLDIPRKHKRSLGLHPSSACKVGICHLRLYYEITGEINAVRLYDKRMHRIFDTGHVFHQIHQYYFHQMYGAQFRDEVPITDEATFLSSSADGEFDFTDLNITLEIKTIKEGGSYGWAKVQNKPLADNLRQLHFYMRYSDNPFGILLYINKNDGLYKEHPVVFDPVLWDSIENSVVAPVVAAVKNEQPPAGSPGYQCNQCSVAYRCPAKQKELKRGSRPKRFPSGVRR